MSEEKLTIRMREHGPLVLPAKFKIVDHLGNEFILPAGKENVACSAAGNRRANRSATARTKPVGSRRQRPRRPPPTRRRNPCMLIKKCAFATFLLVRNT